MPKVKIPDSLPWRVSRGWVHPSFDGPSPQSTNGDFAICEPFGPDAHWNVAYIVHAANCYPALVEALKQMVANFRPFASRPVGAPGSDARLQQNAQCAAYNKARAALKAAGVET